MLKHFGKLEKILTLKDANKKNRDFRIAVFL